MPKTGDASSSYVGGFEPSFPEANLEDNHATKSGGPELAEVASGVKGSYGGPGSAIPSCSYGSNHSSVGGKIDKADE